MDFKVLIAFGIGIGAYLVGLGIFTLIKAILYKRKVKKDLEQHKEEFIDECKE